MTDEILSKLGLTPEPDDHPTDNTGILQKLGLKPEDDDHPTVPPKPAPTMTDRLLGRGTERVQTWPERFVRGVGHAMGEAATTPQTVRQPNPYPEGSEENAWFEGQRQNAMVSGANSMAGFAPGSPAIIGKAGLPAVMGAPGMVAEGGRALGGVVRDVRPTGRAYNFIADKLEDESPEVLARLRDNPRLRLMDVNEPLGLTAQGLVDPRSPRAASAIVRAAKSSAKNAEGSVRGLFDTATGPAPNTFSELQRLQATMESVGKSKIQPALDAGKPVDTSGVIADIDKALNPAPVKMTPGTQITPTPLQQRLIDLRRDIAAGDGEVLVDPGRLHELQSNLRREASDLIASPVGAERKLGRELMDYRMKLVDSIDKSAPGYKKGLQGYKDAADAERAFDMGRDALVNGKDIKTYPEYWENWLKHKNRTPEELEAVKLGARDAIERKMAQFKFAARRGTDIPEVDFDKQKLELLFGKKETERLWQGLHDEKDIAYRNNRILHNSKTAETTAAQKEIEPREIAAPHSQLPTWATMMGLGTSALTSSPTLGVAAGAGLLGARGLKAGYQWAGRRSDISRNAALARIISSEGPQRDEALREIMSVLNRRGSGTKFPDLLAPP